MRKDIDKDIDLLGKVQRRGARLIRDKSMGYYTRDQSLCNITSVVA